MSYKVWGEITYPFPDFNGASLEISFHISWFVYLLQMPFRDFFVYWFDSNVTDFFPRIWVVLIHHWFG